MITALACLLIGFGLGVLCTRWEQKSDEIDAILNATREDR